MTVVFINNSVYSFENPQIYLSMVFILDRFQNIIKLKSTQKKKCRKPKTFGFWGNSLIIPDRTRDMVSLKTSQDAFFYVLSDKQKSDTFVFEILP